MTDAASLAGSFVLWKCGGPVYLTSDGRRAVVLESNMILATREPILQGRVEGVWHEWGLDGVSRDSDGGADIEPGRVWADDWSKVKGASE